MSRDHDSEFEYTYIADVICVSATDKALLVEIEGDSYWIPRSVIGPDSAVQDINDYGELSIKSWFADKEGIC